MGATVLSAALPSSKKRSRASFHGATLRALVLRFLIATTQCDIATTQSVMTTRHDL